MKRSEMEKIIDKALTKWNGAYYDESLESFILTCIEDAGMIPPLGELKPGLFKHHWEPENEA